MHRQLRIVVRHNCRKDTNCIDRFSILPINAENKNINMKPVVCYFLFWKSHLYQTEFIHDDVDCDDADDDDDEYEDNHYHHHHHENFGSHCLLYLRSLHSKFETRHEKKKIKKKIKNVFFGFRLGRTQSVLLSCRRQSRNFRYSNFRYYNMSHVTRKPVFWTAN